MKKTVLLAASIATMLILAGCSAGLSSPKVNITAAGFQPQEITVKSGTEVTWTNQDNKVHAVSAQGLRGSTVYPGKTFTHTFDEAGTVQYWCRLHPEEVGTVNVK